MWFAVLLCLARATEPPKAEVRAGICWALCRRDGYETGTYDAKAKDCICMDRKRFKEITDKVIRIQTLGTKLNPDSFFYDED